MGWISDAAPAHEGFLVGLVRDSEKVGGFRELRYPDESHGGKQRIAHVHVECECGWRSPPLHAPLGTEWSPFTVKLPRHETEDYERGSFGLQARPPFEPRCRQLWQDHVTYMLAHDDLPWVRTR